MSARGPCVTLLLAALLLLGAPASGTQRSKPRKQSGTWFLLAVKDNESVGRTRFVIEKRCRWLGISCSIEQGSHDQPNRLMLRFSTRMAAGRVKEILLARGVEVRAVVSPSFPDTLLEYWSRVEAEVARGARQEVFPFLDVERETFLIVESTLILTGNDLRNCGTFKSPDGSGQYEVDCRLRRAGAARLLAWTSASIDRYIAVVFNGWVVSAAYIKGPIAYNFSISGGFDERRARDLAIIFESGNLPAAVELLEEGAYSR